MVMLQQTRVYKILSAPDWAQAEQLGYTQTALDEGDGYVHLSTRAQVAETLSLHYPGQTDVRLLEYIAEEMSGPIRWEESRGGQLFPHLYATLQIFQKVTATPFSPKKGGGVKKTTGAGWLK